MRAFIDGTVSKPELLAVLHEHAKQDRFRQDYGYWVQGRTGEFKGDAVGCSIEHWTFDRNLNTFNPDQGGIHEQYENLFGIPAYLAWWEDRLFEEMSPARSREWPIQFIEAINVGADLSRVHRSMMRWLASDADSPMAPLFFRDYHIRRYQHQLLKGATDQVLYRYCSRVLEAAEWDYDKQEAFHALAHIHYKFGGGLEAFAYLCNPEPMHQHGARSAWRQKQADLLSQALLQVIREIPGELTHHRGGWYDDEKTVTGRDLGRDAETGQSQPRDDRTKNGRGYIVRAGKRVALWLYRRLV